MYMMTIPRDINEERRDVWDKLRKIKKYIDFGFYDQARDESQLCGGTHWVPEQKVKG